MKYVIIFFLFSLTISFSQVGIGTTNPQAQLDVTNGNVRFSSYGSGSLKSGNEIYILGVEADGDIVEVTDSFMNNRGLQYFTWNTANIATPAITDIRVLGLSTSSGLWTADLNNAARASIAPDADGYIIRYVGTLNVENTGSFTFSARSDDGSRIYIDDVLVVENWFDQPPVTRTGTINLAKGQHRIEFFYYENGGGDFMEFTWGANPDGYTVGNTLSASDFFVN